MVHSNGLPKQQWCAPAGSDFKIWAISPQTTPRAGILGLVTTFRDKAFGLMEMRNENIFHVESNQAAKCAICFKNEGEKNIFHAAQHRKNLHRNPKYSKKPKIIPQGLCLGGGCSTKRQAPHHRAQTKQSHNQGSENNKTVKKCKINPIKIIYVHTYY